MADASWVTDLNKKEHRNWVTVGCALNITKNGISKLVQRKMEAWYQSLISKAPLEKWKLCTCTRRSRRKCATCDTWEKELERLHKSKDKSKICWQNSNRKSWGSSNGAWEVAKIFMPTLGSRRSKTINAETTDLGDLLNLLEWCPIINLTDELKKILCRVRNDCRHKWAHAPKQELLDDDVNRTFRFFNNLLKNEVFRADEQAQKASKELQELRSNGLVNVRESEIKALHLLRHTLESEVTACQSAIANLQVKVDQLIMRSEGRQADQNLQEAISKVKENVDLDRAQLETRISQVEQSVEYFNSLLDEQGDLQGSIDNIREDMAWLKDSVNEVSTDLATTRDKVASLESEVRDSARATDARIAGLEGDVQKVKEEIKSAKTSGSWGQDDAGDTLFTAPCKLSTFVGRESALTWLHEHLILKAAETCPEALCTTKTICGLGGCGKTSLGIEFAWKNKALFPGGVFWINVENDENINKSVIEILALRDILPASTIQSVEEPLNAFFTFLSKKTLPWLLVLDNADKLHPSKCPAGFTKIVEGLWQRSDAVRKNGRMLVTSRRNLKETTTCLKISSGDCLELSCLSDDEGARFLMQRTGMSLENALNQDALLLASELGGLPLALEQAAAYLCALPIPCSFRDYLNKYQEVKLHLLKEQPATALSIEAHYRLSVHTTWEINLEFVKEKSPAAASMMRIAAFLESEMIPISVINPGVPLLDQKELRENAGAKMDIASMLKVLSSYSLFSVDNEAKVFSVHKLVQEVVRDSLTMDEKTVETLLAATRVIHCALLKNSEPFLLDIKQRLTNLSMVKKEERNLLVAIILGLRTLQSHMEKEIDLRGMKSKEVLFNPDTLSLYKLVFDVMLGDISFNVLRAELSEFKLKIERFLYDNPDPNKVLPCIVQHCVAKICTSRPKQRKEAKELALEAEQKLSEFENSNLPVTNESKYRVLNLKVSFYAEEENWEEYSRALWQLFVLAESDYQLVNILMRIAMAEYFISASNFQSSLELCRRLLGVARETFPPTHPEVFLSTYNIMSLLHSESVRQGPLNNKDTLQEALKYADELMEMAKKQPPASPNYIAGITTALQVKNAKDPQTSEHILLDILKERWPNIYQYVITGEMATCSLVPEDGSNAHAARVLDTLEHAFLAQDPVIKERKGRIYLRMYFRIGEILLSIRKKFGSDPELARADRFVENVRAILETTEKTTIHDKLREEMSKHFFLAGQVGKVHSLLSEVVEKASNGRQSSNKKSNYLDETC